MNQTNLKCTLQQIMNLLNNREAPDTGFGSFSFLRSQGVVATDEQLEALAETHPEAIRLGKTSDGEPGLVTVREVPPVGGIPFVNDEPTLRRVIERLEDREAPNTGFGSFRFIRRSGIDATDDQLYALIGKNPESIRLGKTRHGEPGIVLV